MEPTAPQTNSGFAARQISSALWLLFGALLGLGIAAICPNRPLTAATSDRNEKFGMCTVYVGENLEAVFVLDFLTGRLTGACLGKQGNQFVAFFEANVANDLKITSAKPQYAMVPGLATIRATPGTNPAASVIYVSELTSGKVGCYGIPFKLPNAKNLTPLRLAPLDFYTFRDAVPAE